MVAAAEVEVTQQNLEKSVKLMSKLVPGQISFN